MRRSVLLVVGIVLCLLAFLGCNRPSKVDRWRLEKHVRDSVALVEQQRSLVYYQALLDSLVPQADSLIALFKYEKNEKYQDHGYYVATGRKGLRVLVRDDGQQLLMYRNGKRITEAEDEALSRAQHLQVVINDTQELEKRIRRTSLEIQKYQKRL